MNHAKHQEKHQNPVKRHRKTEPDSDKIHILRLSASEFKITTINLLKALIRWTEI